MTVNDIFFISAANIIKYAKKIELIYLELKRFEQLSELIRIITLAYVTQ